MTIALVVPQPATMPGYNNTVDLDEVHSLTSYPQSSMTSSTSGMFSFSHTEPSADLVAGSSWATTAEAGPQNFQDFSDNGSAHSGDAEDYIFTSGQTTPRGTRILSQGRQDIQNAWSSRTAPAMPQGGHAMSRVSSSRSSGSSLSQASQLSMDVTGNVYAFRNGSQAGSITGMDSCLLLDSETNWPTYGLDMGLNADTTFSLPDASPFSIVPSQTQLGPDVGVITHSPGSWDFSSSISQASSPATTTDDLWRISQSPNSSPEIPCQSPSIDRKVPIVPEEVTTSLTQLEEPLTLPPASPFPGPRRQNSEGESARDHDLYKKAAPLDDGLYHCPWEGTTSCNHKPEKLKCNYDKFVDSHLKPYRCKADSCEGARFSSTACLLRHEREAHGLHGHGEKPFLCIYEGCERANPGNGFPRQWNLRDHMKRVHNDHGSSGGSPPSGTANSSKGRKRKTDVPETQANSRKSAVKSMPAPEPKEDLTRPLLDQWMDHRKVVEILVQGLVKPEDTRNFKQIHDVQDRLTAMLKLTTDLNTAAKAVSFTGTG
ncbi:hypothetical protein B0T10DRAFT_526402 [Thelonectria olida]|uniref:C2H2-type domain-containing protein n=1 Tax=Thelonectria olida TaxID=1576542 RepID=A0A9P9ARY2_9HYPO|nr:hypothetical protein B0T10DRAFT_526402 [Thelonectria olida]